MPTRSASASFGARVVDLALRREALGRGDAADAPRRSDMPVVAPIRIAASIAAAEARLARLAFCIERAMWRCVTCAISCASTPASSASFLVAVTRPALTPMKPPGSANALIAESRTAKNVKRCAPSCAWLASRMPSDWRYSLISGSSMIWPASRSCRTIIRPILYSSASDSVVACRRADVGQLAAGRLRHGGRRAGGEHASRRIRGHARIGNFLAVIPVRPHGTGLVRRTRLRALPTRSPRAASARRAPASRGRRAASRGSG